MNINKHFEKYYSKLRLEAIFKSALCGISVGFSANLLAAIITFFLPVNGLWISLGVFAGVSVACAFLFYFKKYRPNDEKNARRIDRLGLEERLITMVELDGDNSYIAKAQREDAKTVLATVAKSSIRFLIPKAIVVPSICLAVCAGGMTTVNALADNGIIKGGDEIIEEMIDEKNTEYVAITYSVQNDEGGVIEGDEAQVVIKGTDATPVTAVADEGFMFQQWSDGNTNPTRFDKAVNEELEIFAVFVEVEEPDEGEGGDGGGDEPGEPSDKEGNQGGGGTNGPPKDNLMGGGAPKPDGSDYVNDGNTDYHGELDGAKENASGRGESEGWGEGEGSIVDEYMGIL